MWLSFAVAVSALFAAADPPVPAASAAAELYKAGRLAEARAAANASDAILTCRLALYANDLAKALPCLRRQATLNPVDRTVAALLAEAEYRSRDFAAAAAAFGLAGRAGHTQRLHHFGKTGPYSHKLKGPHRIPFIRLDPLPIVQVRINGGPLLNFVLDTGGADTIIDPQVAKDAGAQTFGQQTGLFAGGATAVVATAAVDRIDLAEFEIRNLPVTILKTGQFSEAFGGLPIAGVIGTGLMSQFLSTIDYPGQQLVLQRRQTPARPRGTALPMWLVGDHFILVEGRLEGERQLAFIDTGLAGLGCTVPQSTFDKSRLSAGAARPGGAGGGGDVGKVMPFKATIALGSVTRTNVSCILGSFPAQLETLAGTRVGMLVSHEFLKPYAVTFDFDRMRMVLAGPTAPSRTR